VHVLLTRLPGSRVRLRPSDGGPSAAPDPAATQDVEAAGAAAVVRRLEDDARHPRWTWDDTDAWYPGLLADGVRLDRAHDLRLAHRVLRTSAFTRATELATAPPGPWDALEPVAARDPRAEPRGRQHESLFDLDDVPAGSPSSPGPPAPASDDLDPAAELAAQQAALAGSTAPGRLRLLLAAESAGALAAAEMHHAGLPWRADVHDAILTDALGPRPAEGRRPDRLEALADRIRAELIGAGITLEDTAHGTHWSLGT